MPSGQYSYIDIAAHDAVRGRFAAGDAAVILTSALDDVIWANGAGAALFGYPDIGSIIGQEPQIGFAAKRQIMATSGYPRIGKDRAITVRLASGLTSRAVSFVASEIELPGGEEAILLAVPAATASWRSPAEAAARAIAGLGQAGQHAAIIDAEGKVVAASDGFEELGIGAGALAALIAGAQGERVVKRVIETATAFVPAGLVRLTDEPAIHLLVVVDEALPQDDMEEAANPTVSTAGELPVDTNSSAAAEVGVASDVDSNGGGDMHAPTTQDMTAPDIAQAETVDEDLIETLPQDGTDAHEQAVNQAEALPEEAETGAQEREQEEHARAAAAEREGPTTAEISDEAASAADAEQVSGEAVEAESDHREDWYFAGQDRRADDGHADAEPTVAAAAEAESFEAVPAETTTNDLAAAEPEETVSDTAPANTDETHAVSAQAPETAEQPEEAPQPLSETVEAAASAIAADRSAAPVRFVWKTDAEGRFSEISAEFATAVGQQAADMIGVHFRDAARKLGFDPGGEIAGLLERRDTWSGRSVLWPVAGTDLRIPVDLAALPSYDRNRVFAGFRGFGVARAGDAIVDPDALGLALVKESATGGTVAADHSGAAQEEEPAASPELPIEGAAADEGHATAGADPFNGEVPVLSIASRQERRSTDKVIRLAEHRLPPNDKSLSPGERNAFREIGDRLRKDSGVPVVEPPGEPQLKADNDLGPRRQAEQEQEARDSQPTEAATPGDNLQEAAETIDKLIAEGDRPAEAVEESAEPGIADGAEASSPDAADMPVLGEAVPEAEPIEAETGEPGEQEAEIPVSAESADGVTPTPSPSPQGGGELHMNFDPLSVSGFALDTSPPIDGGEDAPAARLGTHPLPSRSGGEVSRRSRDGEGAKGEFAPYAIGGDTRSDEPSDGSVGFTRAASAVGAGEAPDFVPSAFAIGQAAQRPPVDTTILEQLPIPVLIHSGDTLHYANREFLEFTGYDAIAELEEAGGLDALFGEPYANEDGSAGAGRKLRLRTSEGLEYPVEAFLQSVPWGEGKALLLSLKRSWRHPVSYPASPSAKAPPDSDFEERIAEMRAIVDTATDGVVLISREGMIRSISRPAEALFGFDSADIAGKPFTSLFAIESQRAARDYLTGLSENGVASVLNDGREVIGRESQGRFIPLFMTMGKLPNDSGFCAVVRDITQWKRAEEELTQARAQAERASSQKTEFLARVSHEIRTPLNAIIGFSELMLDEKFGPITNDRYRDYLRDINRSGNHVLDLVNDLLDISKIEAGQQEMSYEAVSLNDTLAETVAMMQPQANRERVIIRSSFASRLPEVVADLRSVRQIALNLLSNAIRYTPAGGQVIVSTAYEASGDVVMRVRDTGIGMSQAEIEQALKPFKQINALKRTRGDGTGLGLPLTKAMVEANRARFMINSTPGEGTLVEITFPSTRVLAD